MLVVLLALGRGGATVEAHADLVSSDPAADAQLRQAPSSMTLTFSQGLKPTGSFVQLTDSKGTLLAVQATYDTANPKLMRTTLPSLPPDLYAVKWQTLSADDDDYHDGTFTFVVLEADGSLPVAAQGSDGGQTSSDSTDGSGGNSNGPLIIAIGAAVALVGGAYLYIARGRKGPA
jgi:methionine-rich copper-binding protein CopC